MLIFILGSTGRIRFLLPAKFLRGNDGSFTLVSDCCESNYLVSESRLKQEMKLIGSTAISNILLYQDMINFEKQQKSE